MSIDPDNPPPRFISPSPEGEFYWQSGADGRLRIQRCGECRRWIHPAGPVCPYCHSRDLSPEPVAGTGTIATFTINRKEWIPGFEPPYVFALVELDEDPTIRISTNIVGCEIDDVAIDMQVEVEFEKNGDWFVPLFHPRVQTRGDD
jgi:uncharacterized OB-fold protein